MFFATSDSSIKTNEKYEEPKIEVMEIDENEYNEFINILAKNNE